VPEFDIDGALAGAGGPEEHQLLCSFSTTTFDDDDEGEVVGEENGWINGPDNPLSVEPDEYDLEEGKTAVDLAVKLMRDEGASQASSSHFHVGVWYSNEGELDRQGELTSFSYHLKGFTPSEECEVFRRMHR